MYGSGWGMHHGGGFLGGGMFGGGIFGMFLNILLLLLVVWVVIRLVQSLMGRGASSRPTEDNATRSRDRDDSLNILKARFARGEIDEEEYQRMRNMLES